MQNSHTMISSAGTWTHPVPTLPVHMQSKDLYKSRCFCHYCCCPKEKLKVPCGHLGNFQDIKLRPQHFLFCFGCFCFSFSQGVWWGSDGSVSDHSVSWLPWELSGRANLLLAHPCTPGPKDPPSVSGVWCRRWHVVSRRLPGSVWQLWWRLRLRWEVRITRGEKHWWLLRGPAAWPPVWSLGNIWHPKLTSNVSTRCVDVCVNAFLLLWLGSELDTSFCHWCLWWTGKCRYSICVWIGECCRSVKLKRS